MIYTHYLSNRNQFLLLVRVLLLVFFLVAIPQVVWSQEGTTASVEDVSADEINEVARELWCPLCSGVRLDACELKACDQMKDVIALKLSEGETTDTIRDYFVEQYGPQVLGEPPREGFNWLAWILPFVALAVGAWFLWSRSQQMMQPKDDSGGVVSAAGPAPSADSSQNKDETVSQEGGDEYRRKLEEELDRYG